MKKVSIIFLFLVAGCGNGALHLHEKNEKAGKIPPGPFLQHLDRALKNHDDLRVRELLTGLAEESNDRMDWEKFWDELSILESRSELTKKFPSETFGLHRKDCESYPVFVHFLRSVAGGLEYVFTEKRQCQTALPPATAVALAKLLQSREVRSKVTLLRIFNFIISETKKQKYAVPWDAQLFVERDWLKSLGRSLMAEEETIVVFAFSEERAERGDPELLGDIAERAVRDQKTRRQWLARYGFAEAVSRWKRYLPESRQLHFEGNEVRQFVDDLNKNLSSIEIAKSPAWIFGQVEHITRKLSEDWSLKDQLSLIDKTLSAFSAKFPKFDFRSLVFESPAGEPALREAIGALDELSHAVTDRQRSTAAKKYCDLLNESNVPAVTFTGDQLQFKLEQGLNAGCFTLSPDTLPLHKVTSKTSLSASFASVLFFFDTSLELESSEIRLGNLVGKTTKTRPEQTPPKNSVGQNGITFPLLLSLALPKKTALFSPGSSFFIFHFVARWPATGNQADAALPGYLGPTLTLRSNTPIAPFTFVSLGGPGQRGTPSLRGGLGDRSVVSLEHLNDWVQNTASSGAVKDLPLPARFHEKLSLAELNDLLTHSERDSSQKIKLRIVPEFVQRIPREQKVKIVDFCKHGSEQPFDRQSLATCLQNEIVPQAIAQLLEILDDNGASGNLSISASVPQCDAENPYLLEDGNLGPQNGNGPPGKAGDLKIMVGDFRGVK
jgi:hypothetical protein